MGHDHHHHSHAALKNIKIAFFLNLGFTIVELIGGFLTNSTAILADAIHDMGDSFALGQAWYFESLSKKKGSVSYTYGYRRFTLLGALISALLLVASSFFVLYQAVPRIMDPQPSHAQGMAALAIMGIAVNGFAMLRLARGESANIRVVALHLLEDVLGWFAVLVVAIVLMFKEINILDPILAVLITLYILANTVKHLKGIIPVFLQAAPVGVDVVALERQLAAMELVDSVHHMHIWSLDGDHDVLTAHLVTERPLLIDEYADLKQRLKKVVEQNGIHHSTLEIEWHDEGCRITAHGITCD